MSDLVIGCYTAETGGAGSGVTAVRRDPDSGRLEPIAGVLTTPSPSFLAWHPRLPVLYAVNEVDTGTLSAWALPAGWPSGQPDAGVARALPVRGTGGGQPCHLAVSPGGGAVVVANYGTGSVATFRLDAGGEPTERVDLAVHSGHGLDPDRQERAHAHFVGAGAPGEVLAVDLGNDAVYRYRPDRGTGRLGPGEVLLSAPPGTGPRHLATGPDGTWYLVGELSGQLLIYRRDRGGTWRLVEQVATTVAAAGQPSEVVVSTDGRHCYVANRGPDTVAVFGLDGGLPRYLDEVPTGGHWPRHFALVGGWLYVANERSHSIAVMPVDAATGIPGPPEQLFPTPSPTCVLPVPAGRDERR